MTNAELLSPPPGEGFAPIHFAIRDGVRASAAESFLRPEKDRVNLKVVTHATVDRVRSGGNGRRGVYGCGVVVVVNMWCM